MGKPGNTGITRIIKAAGYSWQGLNDAFKHEAAFRQELALCVILIPLGAWLGQDGVERALLIGCLFLVLITELLNSAVEAIVDRVGTEQHKLSGRAKDIGSAAVLLSLLMTAVVWALVLADRWL
jgi:diacylglycerol kinase (ATP)